LQVFLFGRIYSKFSKTLKNIVAESWQFALTKKTATEYTTNS
jgi:hypothetical protein